MATDYRQHDLHCHSTASDGELTPAQLVRHAFDNGVEVLALTDHDVTDGLAEAAAEAAQHGLQFISGVEISVNWNDTLIHIVGLNFNPDDATLQQGLADLRQQRGERANEMARRLADMGIEGALEGAAQHANGQIISRTHFARHLHQSGHVKTLQEAFDRFIGCGKKAYVSCDWTSLERAVAWITTAGGHAVIAHPARYNLSATRLRLLIHDFKEAGGEALEVISGSQDVTASRNIADYSVRFALHASVGSDYHGPSQHWRSIGRLPPLPAKCTPVWQLWA